LRKAKKAPSRRSTIASERPSQPSTIPNSGIISGNPDMLQPDGIPL
jgi:hypothetical protein